MELKIVKPSTDAERKTRTTTDCWEVTPAQARSWKLPPFQRALKVNSKVVLLSEEIKNNHGVLPGVFTIGILDKERWLVDGQHRREAFLMSESPVGYVDVRIVHFDSMAEMAEEFVALNSRIVNMKPDDIIRGLESACEPVAKLRKRCPYVGYDNIRRGDKSPVAAMAAVLRCWHGSAPDTPRPGGASAPQLASEFTPEDCDQLQAYLESAFTAWGRDATNNRLYGALNMILTMWLFRRMVLSAYSVKTQRISAETFTKCLMSLSAETTYVDWLHGRTVGARDFTPAYTRIKTIFAKRLEMETGKRPLLPAPAWSTGSR